MGYPVFMEPTIDSLATRDDGRQEDMAPNGQEVQYDGSQEAYQEFKAEAESLYERLRMARIHADEWFEKVHEPGNGRAMRLHLVMLCWEARDAGKVLDPSVQFEMACHFPVDWKF